VKLIAKVVSSSAGRIYKIATSEEQESALSVPPSWSPSQSIYYDPRKGANTAVLYGLKEFGDIFTSRQKYALNGFADALAEIKEEVDGDCLNLGINSTGDEPRYSDAVCLYLAFAISKIADRGSTICSWDSSRESIRSTFGRQALAMTWDFVESNPLSSSSGSFANAVEQICKALRQMPISATRKGYCIQSDAQSQSLSAGRVVSTDPPYYDNIGYSDLSDFFYVWLRRSLSLIGFSDLLRTVSAPKGEELVVQPTRHSSAEAAEMFFLQGMQTALSRASTLSHPAFPCTVYYAFKQSEDKDKEGAVITGWEVFLSSVLSAGLSIEGTWPLRTELGNRMVGAGANALASSMVLVCGLRNAGAKTISRAEFKRILRKELPASLRRLERSNTAPVDMAQAAIGPGMEIYSKYKAVLNSDDTPMVVKEALIEINKALDEHLNQEEGEFDADSRFALTFFETYGYEDRPYGDAEGLAVARNISVEGVARSGILAAIAGRVCLLRREQLIEEWNPMSDERICVWEATQYLIKRLEDGEAAAASLLAQLKDIKGHGDLSANCRALAYRLYNHCEKTKQAEEARAYNGLVIAWPELEKLSVLSASSVQPSLL
jgi:putative DNA methylase